MCSNTQPPTICTSSDTYYEGRDETVARKGPRFMRNRLKSFIMRFGCLLGLTLQVGFEQLQLVLQLPDLVVAQVVLLLVISELLCNLFDAFFEF
jgi:hypothetical protein